MNRKVYVRRNTFFLNTMPWSEVCMHMQIAGKPMICELVSDRMVQLYEPNFRELDGATSLRDALKPFSAPILTGEAGIFEESNLDLERKYYIYKDVRER